MKPLKDGNGGEDPPKRGLMYICAFAALGLIVWHFATPASEARFRAHQKEAYDAMENAIKLCKDKFVYKEIATYQQMAECATPGILDAFHDAGFPYMDLVQAFADERVALAKQVDTKQITKEEALKKEDEFLADLQASAQARRDGGK